MKKRIKWIIGIAIGVIAIVWLINPFSKNKKGKSTLETTIVERGTLSNSVTATGTVEPILLVQIGTQVSGVISRVYVDYNSTVKKGQVLAEIDKRNLLSDLQTRQSDFGLRKADMDFQEKNYLRQKELWEKGAISETAWEQAQYNFKTSKLNVSLSEAALIKAKTNLDYATITSSIDGVVISKAIEEGQTVAASFNTPTLFTIANDLTKMWVIADVDEADIGNIKEGQTVKFTVDAFPDDEFTGKVEQVRLDAKNTANVITYQVVINAPNPELRLKPGLTANVSIMTLEKENVLLIPQRAMRFVPNKDQFHSLGIHFQINTTKSVEIEKGTHTVWKKSGNSISPVQVQLGLSNGFDVEIQSNNIKEGDTLVLAVQNVMNLPNKASSPFMPKRPGSR